MFVPRRVISAWGISVRMDVLIFIFDGFFWRSRIYQNLTGSTERKMHLVDPLGNMMVLEHSIWFLYMCFRTLVAVHDHSCLLCLNKN